MNKEEKAQNRKISSPRLANEVSLVDLMEELDMEASKPEIAVLMNEISDLTKNKRFEFPEPPRRRLKYFPPPPMRETVFPNPPVRNF